MSFPVATRLGLRARSLQTIAALVAGWVAVSVAVGVATTPDDQPADLALSALFGLVIGGASAWFELTALPRYGRRLSPGWVLALRTVFYAGASAAAAVLLIGWAARETFGVGFLAVYREPELWGFFATPAFVAALAALTLASFAINFARQVRLMLGPGTLGALLVGRYRLPVREERAFLFLDLTGSTATAQRLGPRRFNDFKNDFFRDVAGPILATGGQIYQYVGDEVVVTWRVRDGRLVRSPVETFLLLDETIARRADRYRARYGEVPAYKAGLHCGEVVTAEVGELKKDIVHSGDTVNVTARIEGRCHALGARLLASDAALELAPLPAGVEVEEVGAVDLRGRAGAVRLFRVGSQRAAPDPASGNLSDADPA